MSAADAYSYQQYEENYSLSRKLRKQASERDLNISFSSLSKGTTPQIVASNLIFPCCQIPGVGAGMTCLPGWRGQPETMLSHVSLLKGI